MKHQFMRIVNLILECVRYKSIGVSGSRIKRGLSGCWYGDNHSCYGKGKITYVMTPVGNDDMFWIIVNGYVEVVHKLFLWFYRSRCRYTKTNRYPKDGRWDQIIKLLQMLHWWVHTKIKPWIYSSVFFNC